ncbi:MAG: hypothetical protein E6J14_11580 [Chloroflexi bacterium]|nr:MAG: hypothetical protein E6J14_11580 [Chloroflexota bacterium]
MSAVARRFGRLSDGLAGWRTTVAAREARAICPVDSWPFRPRYTDGHCPLCGWEAPGVIAFAPLSRRIGTFGWMVVGMFAASMAMSALVLVTYFRS